MVDIYIAGSNDETIEYVSSSFIVYKNDQQILKKAWVTNAKNQENISNLGEYLALLASLRLSLAMKYEAVRIYCSMPWIVNLINKHKLNMKKAIKLKCELLETIDACKCILLSAIKVSANNLRYSICKGESKNALYEKANSIEMNSNLVLYTDGAYNPKTGYYGAGVVIYSNEEKQIIDTIAWKDNKNNKSKVVAGCLLAVTNAIEWCIDRKIYDKVTIAVTNLGGSSWANDSWKAENGLTKEYKDLINNYSEEVDFIFRHVYKRHRNELMNKATELAENVCGFIRHE